MPNEDEKAAIRLYAELKKCGLLPWRDKIAILPGKNYKLLSEERSKLADIL